MSRGLLILVAAAAVVLTVGPCRGAPDAGPSQGIPTVSPNEPGPGDPPVVWLSGTLEAVEEEHVSLREGQGPRVRLERLAAGATSFFRVEGGAWRRLSEDEVDLLSVGGRACVEALLDGRTFLALRVFLGSGCGPAQNPAAGGG